MSTDTFKGHAQALLQWEIHGCSGDIITTAESSSASKKIMNDVPYDGWQSANLDINKNHTHTLSMNSIGNNNPHNNIQPYNSCYIWKRVS